LNRFKIGNINCSLEFFADNKIGFGFKAEEAVGWMGLKHVYKTA
jgi:hypothetical protein